MPLRARKGGRAGVGGAERTASGAPVSWGTGTWEWEDAWRCMCDTKELCCIASSSRCMVAAKRACRSACPALAAARSLCSAAKGVTTKFAHIFKNVSNNNNNSNKNPGKYPASPGTSTLALPLSASPLTAPDRTKGQQMPSLAATHDTLHMTCHTPSSGPPGQTHAITHDTFHMTCHTASSSPLGQTHAITHDTFHRTCHTTSSGPPGQTHAITLSTRQAFHLHPLVTLTMTS